MRKWLLMRASDMMAAKEEFYDGSATNRCEFSGPAVQPGMQFSLEGIAQPSGSQTFILTNGATDDHASALIAYHNSSLILYIL
jgi:hypothetical protein